MVYANNLKAEPDTADVEAAARALGQKILVVSPGGDEEIDEAFAKLAQARAGALMVSPSLFFSKPSRKDRGTSGPLCGAHSTMRGSTRTAAA